MLISEPVKPPAPAGNIFLFHLIIIIGNAYYQFVQM